MPLSDLQQQSLIIAQVGDYDGIVAQHMAAIWEQHSSRTAVLRALYAKRDAIDLLLGSVRELVDFTGPNGVSMQQSQRADILGQMRKSCLADIERSEKSAAGSVGMPASGMIKAVAPISSDFPPGGNDPRYRGTTYQ